MRYTYSLPCALDSDRVAILLRDLSRTLNYVAPSAAQPIAVLNDHGLISRGWNELPHWVERLELSPDAGAIHFALTVDVATEAEHAQQVAQGLMQELSSLFAYPVRRYDAKVFCIGWHCTGTTSLATALRMLGLFSWHFLPWAIGHTHFSDEASANGVDIDAIAPYTTLSDWPIPIYFEALDRAFPDSLFIYTTRDQPTWEASAVGMARDIAARDGCLHSVDRWVYGTDAVDPARFRQRFMHHRQQVLDYFADCDNCLVLDVTQGDPWPALCTFLQVPQPEVPFPHLARG
jgi:Sulfotransferase domain